MYDEVLNYLGYKNQIINKDLENTIKETINEGKKHISEKFVIKKFKFKLKKDGINLIDNDLDFKSKDLKKHLKDCEEVMIIALSVGFEIERLINMYQTNDMLKALILDAFATSYIEKFCDRIQEDVEQTLKPNKKYLTSRFSCGYGDFLLEEQKKIIKLLDTKKSIGLYLSSSNILTPKKSITAFIGISDKKTKKLKKCENCNLRFTCYLNKEEHSCD